MKKKLTRGFALLLIGALLCGGLPVCASASRFTDVPAGAWYANAVEDMAQKGIISGKTANTFDPNGTLSRAEFATMISKCALTSAELKEYDFKSRFSDVSNSHWGKKSINWASEAGVISGTGGGLFNPSGKVTRQDIAVMVYQFVQATGQQLPATQGPMLFVDKDQISGYARASVTACQRGGVISSRGDMRFAPKGTATRAEAAVILSKLLQNIRSSGYKIIRKRLYGTSFRAVEFDPDKFTAGVAMPKGRVRGGESVGSMVSRTGAKIAVNAAFFDMSSYEALGTIIDDGRIITTFERYSPAKSAIVMDSSGRFSVQNFATRISGTVTAANGGQRTVPGLLVNRRPGDNDGSRIVFTRDWGESLGFTAGFAAVVDSRGMVTGVYRGQNVSIPASGYVLALRTPRGDAFEAAFSTGAHMELSVEYEGADSQDLLLALGVGPTLVENGAPYGNSSTYAQEGFATLDTGLGVRRVCIGVRYDGNLVILTAVGSLYEMSQIMAAQGCQSAVNLDGGGSTNLYVNGQWLYGPQDRLLNNMLYFK